MEGGADVFDVYEKFGIGKAVMLESAHENIVVFKKHGSEKRGREMTRGWD